MDCHLAIFQINFELEQLFMRDRRDIAFYYRGVKVWNNLSQDLREITNTKVFKRRLVNELMCNMNKV